MLRKKNLEINIPSLLASPPLLQSSRVGLSSSEGARIRQMLILLYSKKDPTGVKPIFKGRGKK